jgi:hypothetical protein
MLGAASVAAIAACTVASMSGVGAPPQAANSKLVSVRRMKRCFIFWTSFQGWEAFLLGGCKASAAIGTSGDSWRPQGDKGQVNVVGTAPAGGPPVGVGATPLYSGGGRDKGRGLQAHMAIISKTIESMIRFCSFQKSSAIGIKASG